MTKCDTSRELTARHWIVIDALASGQSINEAAQASGLARQTISKWRHRNVPFMAALRQRSHEHRAETRERLLEVLKAAAQTVEDGLSNPDIPHETRLQAAINLICKLGSGLAADAIGSTDERVIAGEIAPQNEYEKLLGLSDDIDSIIDEGWQELDLE